MPWAKRFTRNGRPDISGLQGFVLVTNPLKAFILQEVTFIEKPTALGVAASTTHFRSQARVSTTSDF